MEMTPAGTFVAIDDPSGVAEARRRASELGQNLAFGSTAAGHLAIAVTELASNIVKHAQRGRIALRSLGTTGSGGIEVLAMDRGPGIANLAESLRDGHSTAGSSGTGLGALQRLTTGFEIYTQAGKGTVVRVEVWSSNAPVPGPRALLQGAVRAPKSGETACGDDWAVLSWRGRHALFVVDGLGHGPDAAAAASAAVAAARSASQLAATDLIVAVHDALRPTRGAAAAVAVLDPEKELCTYCGIGNIAASIRSHGATRSMVSHNGILGHQVRKFQDFSYPFPRGALCVAHSDGVSSRWDLATYPGLEQRHPSLVAAVLFRDHGRERDDATVVAVRNAEPGR
jgi:anti-sigma regulatory factor (Ser/Thr protein kinase)